MSTYSISNGLDNVHFACSKDNDLPEIMQNAISYLFENFKSKFDIIKFYLNWIHQKLNFNNKL